jgi:hypothetical protein
MVSPYLAVFLGVFYLKSGFFALLLYYLILLICIVGINSSKVLKLIKSGFHQQIGTLVCLGDLLHGGGYFFLRPFAKKKPSIWPNSWDR